MISYNPTTQDQPQPRPLLEVLDEHTEHQRLRRAALEQLAAHALPADAPGAWIRAAVDQELGR